MENTSKVQNWYRPKVCALDKEFSMSVMQMRDYVASSYKGDGWKRKVANMSDQQVIAIYYRLKKGEK